MKAKSFLSLIFLLGAFVAHTLVPPMSQEDREAFASDIVSGYVIGILKTERDMGRGFSNNEYIVKMIVTEIVKSKLIEPGSTVYFSYYRANRRPHGWCGDDGQYDLVQNNSAIRAYMMRDGDDELHLLSPNGFDVE